MSLLLCMHNTESSPLHHHPYRMDSPEDLYESGIFINDLSMHDSSRDFILAGSQLNPELNLALSQVTWLLLQDTRCDSTWCVFHTCRMVESAGLSF